ncbi:hypothetical protein BgiBS90_020518, partial [Biomphalaria glabrata]
MPVMWTKMGMLSRGQRWGCFHVNKDGDASHVNKDGDASHLNNDKNARNTEWLSKHRESITRSV